MPSLLIIAVAVLTRLPSLGEPLAMDQSLFAVVAQGLLRGERLYVDLWDHKPPAIYLLYAGLGRVFGSAAAWPIALASIAAAVASALLLRALVARRAGERAGFVAGLLYALVASPVFLGGFYATGQAEVFEDLLVIAALVAGGRTSVDPAPRRGRADAARGSASAGILLGTAALFKPTALLWTPLVVLVGRRAAARALPSRAGWPILRFVAGLVAPALVAFAWLAIAGSLGGAYDALVRWNGAALRSAAGGFRGAIVSHSGSTLFDPRALVGLALDGIAQLGPFLAFAAIGAIASRARALPLVWLAAAIVAVAAQGKFYRYQYQHVLAPLCVLSALGVDTLVRAGEKRVPRRAAAFAAALLVSASLVPGTGVVLRYWRLHRIASPFAAASAREQSLATYGWSDPPMSYDDAARVAARVRGATSPGDRIYVLGFDPQIYLLAERAPGGRYLADDHLRAPGAEARLVADFERRQPRWIVVATDRVAPADFPRVSDWVAARAEPRETVGRYALFERVR